MEILVGMQTETDEMIQFHHPQNALNGVCYMDLVNQTVSFHSEFDHSRRHVAKKKKQKLTAFGAIFAGGRCAKDSLTVENDELLPVSDDFCLATVGLTAVTAECCFVEPLLLEMYTFFILFFCESSSVGNNSKKVEKVMKTEGTEHLTSARPSTSVLLGSCVVCNVVNGFFELASVLMVTVSSLIYHMVNVLRRHVKGATTGKYRITPWEREYFPD
ncbi:hypothetical protein GCK72_002123 [Caenorhabditis remanei]|uniref:Uncharacterized protein n=1 Tax=Caenorhabditis remanei TaxID=31234 RepID=A0A6A5HRX0_CAERE|nr:hypothetical protein GCK72_002123 [Caenorhabditis remanei]KAF1770305.1 hypothetical protein GCK72_002123 [Caenorhabditis remanei]